jgi:hypothetical protein
MYCPLSAETVVCCMPDKPTEFVECKYYTVVLYKPLYYTE